jgi:hypothetical protein
MLKVVGQTIEPGGILSLCVDIPATLSFHGQPSPSHAAGIADMSDGPLDEFAAPAQGLSPDPGFQPRPLA